MEPFLLNIAARPNTTSFAQSMYMQTPFKQAAARVYQTHGYETSFIYGGDLSWRNVGVFMKYQGFDHVEGKGSIIGALKTDKAKLWPAKLSEHMNGDRVLLEKRLHDYAYALDMAMHCGFNDADIILSKDGGFKVDKPKTKEQELCNRYYKATLAAGEYLIQSHDKK